MVGDILETIPADDEIEISVFGPGYGESILVHIGDQQWFVIDSCIDFLSKEPASLNYLKKLNIDPSKVIKQIIITHWHDDHIKGIAQVINACPYASIICSAALQSDEFLKLSELYGCKTLGGSLGLGEFKEIIEILIEKGFSTKKGTLIYTMADRLLFKRTLNNGKVCSIYSLSPSDLDFKAAQSQFLKFLPAGYLPPKRSLVATSPNYAAIVLWISIGETNFLLGSDLEESGNPLSGWSVILSSPVFSKEKAFFFKIPHHGSKTGHHPEVWTKLLYEDNICVLTPWQKGNDVLPKKEDVDRICSLSKEAYTTAHLRSSKIKRNHTVDKTIRETVRNIRAIETSTGHVRIRIKPEQQWGVSLFGGASKLEQLYPK